MLARVPGLPGGAKGFRPATKALQEGFTGTEKNAQAFSTEPRFPRTWRSPVCEPLM